MSEETQEGPPQASRPDGMVGRPHCGLCGCEYVSAGYTGATDMRHYRPNCSCWKFARPTAIVSPVEQPDP